MKTNCNATPPVLLLVALLLMALSACDTTVKTDVAEIGEAVENKIEVEASEYFKIDTAQSEATWIGAKITGRHQGVLVIQEGQLELLDSKLVGGRFVFDMTATRTEDKTLDAQNNAKLTTHLRSEDFFDVERYPTALFEITGVVPYDSSGQTTEPARKYSELKVKNPTHRVTGNLTIKGEKKSVTFPVRITMSGGELKAKANFNIDRTQWGLVYRADQSMGNQTIYPEVNIGFDILAQPVSKEQLVRQQSQEPDSLLEKK